MSLSVPHLATTPLLQIRAGYILHHTLKVFDDSSTLSLNITVYYLTPHMQTS